MSSSGSWSGSSSGSSGNSTGGQGWGGASASGAASSTTVDNETFGWIIIGISAAHLLIMCLASTLQIQRWKSTGNAKSLKWIHTLTGPFGLFIWGVVPLLMTFVNFDKANGRMIAKRLGKIAYCMIPLDLACSMRPSPLPNVFYLEMIWLHKWLSRYILLYAFAHVVGLLCLWGKSGTWVYLTTPLNVIGIVAMGNLLVTTFVTLRFFRRAFYKTFYATHLLVVWSVVFIIEWHARPDITPIFGINVGLLGLGLLTKFLKSTDVKVTKLTSPGSALEVVKFNNIYKDNFRPGSHLRISYRKWNPITYFLPTHPYTIASTPDENTVKLIVKKGSYNIKDQSIVSCCGPFPSVPSPFFDTAHNVLLVAGGVGISYTLGIYQRLMEKASVNVHMIWIVRTKADLWLLEHFRLQENVDIYITNSDEAPSSSQNSLKEEELKVDQFLMVSSTDVVKGESSSYSKSDIASEKVFIYGRPDWSKYKAFVAEAAAGKEQLDNNWVVSCGTPSLNSDCAKWANSLKINHHCEAYSM